MKVLNTKILPELNQKAKSLYPSYFLNFEKMINKCCLSICYSVLRKICSLNKKGGSFSFDELIRSENLSEDGFYVLNQILFILVEDDILEFNNGIYTTKKLLDIESPSEMLVSLTRQFPNEGASFQWLARAYEGISDLLSGELYAEDIMFPWGSFDLVEDVYNSSRVYSFFPAMTGYAVQELEKHYFKGNIAVLEIGAGTGNGTDSVIENLKQRCNLYYFTDIMRSALKKAKKKYASFPFMQFKLYDINTNPSTIGFGKNSIDLIIAVNALHASNDCIVTIKHLLSLLKAGGCLLLSEIAPPRNSVYRFMELTFGLLASYYSYNDKETRPLTPIIRPEKWTGLLKKVGFHEVVFAPSGEDFIFDRGGVIIGIKE